MKKSTRHRLFLILVYTVILLGFVFAVIPFIWMIISSLKEQKEIFTVPITYIPKNPTFENYYKILFESSVSKYYLNTLFVSLVSTVIATLMCSVAGYGFSRFRFKGKYLMLNVILLTQMFPHVLLVIPYFIMMRRMGLTDTYASLILSYIAFTIPFAVWMLKGFFDAIPFELDQSAMVDGLTPWGTFFRIVFPLALPGVMAAILYSFLVAWNHYLFAVILVNKESLYVMTVALTHFMGEFGTQWGQLNATAVLMTFPIIILFAFLEKYMVAGMTAGAVKE